MKGDITESWDLIEKVANYVSKENGIIWNFIIIAILISTNEELMSELTGRKSQNLSSLFYSEI